LERVLNGCPGLKILATSRVPLSARGEFEFPVSSLSLPTAIHGTNIDGASEAGAVELFAECVGRASPSFEWNESTVGDAVKICGALRGVPLALEIAAAHAGTLALPIVLSTLEERLKVLGSADDRSAFRQTPQLVVAWSYDALWAAGRRLLRSLCVFVDGFTFIAAGALSQERDDSVLSELLANLLSAGLLQRAESATDEPRYVIHEAVRGFGLQQLELMSEAVVVRRRHATFFANLVAPSATDQGSAGPAEEAWIESIDVELGNVRAALYWSLTPMGDREIGLALAGQLGRYWALRHEVAEGRFWLAALLLSAGDRPSTSVAAAALGVLGVLAWQQGDHRDARRLLEESVPAHRLLRMLGGLSQQLRTLGLIAIDRGEPGAARSFFAEALSLSRVEGDEEGRGLAMQHLADTLVVSDPSSARELYTQSMAIWRNRASLQSASILNSIARMRL